MNYEARKQQIKSQIASNFTMKNNEDSIFMDLVADKIAAEEFNMFFYQGEGVTNSSNSHPTVTLNRKRALNGLVKGIGMSAYVILLVTLGKSRVRISNKLGWVFAIPSNILENRESVNNFENYLDSMLTKENSEIPKTYLVQSGKLRGNIKLPRTKVVPHVGAEILRGERSNRFTVILKVLWRTMYWLQKSFLNPYLVLVGPEFIVDYLAIYERREQELDVLITTQSQLLAPGLVFRAELKARSIMFWYSDNSTQISKHPVKEFDYSYLRQPLINEHFVWTHSWKKILESYNAEAEIKVSGPVIFRAMEKLEKNSNNQLRPVQSILIFDVTPKKSASSNSIYSEESMKKFLVDIVDIATHKLSLASLKLKPKRRYSVSDSPLYLNEIAYLAPRLSKLEWNCDIVEEILLSDLVICIPFTSPALISSYLGVPTVFYAPSQDFILGNLHENIPVLQGRDELGLFFEKIRSIE